jgi:hypothetical protein
MAETIKLFRVFFSAPGDLVEEEQIVKDVLDEWNRQHGDDRQARVELVTWKTHVRPATGDRPQALINKQAFDRADIIVAVFWTRFGTPTGVAESGTVEEIRRGVRLKKEVLVYFSTCPALGKKARPADRFKIDDFKKTFGQKALYWVYSDRALFESAFRDHLAAVMRDLLRATI